MRERIRVIRVPLIGSVNLIRWSRGTNDGIRTADIHGSAFNNDGIVNACDYRVLNRKSAAFWWEVNRGCRIDSGIFDDQIVVAVNPLYTEPLICYIQINVVQCYGNIVTRSICTPIAICIKCVNVKTVRVLPVTGHSAVLNRQIHIPGTHSENVHRVGTGICVVIEVQQIISALIECHCTASRICQQRDRHTFFESLSHFFSGINGILKGEIIFIIHLCHSRFLNRHNNIIVSVLNGSITVCTEVICRVFGVTVAGVIVFKCSTGYFYRCRTVVNFV